MCKIVGVTQFKYYIISDSSIASESLLQDTIYSNFVYMLKKIIL